MWKKDDMTEPATQPPSTPGAASRSEPPRKAAGGGERAAIGRSITIRGDVTGDEDLLIQGRVDGTVDLKQHSVTVGPEGRVKADITGRTVTVEGQVDGNVRAEEQVVLRSASRVHGDVTAPRVVIEDGATFRGSIDMETKTPGHIDRSQPAPKPSRGETGPEGRHTGSDTNADKESAAS